MSVGATFGERVAETRTLIGVPQREVARRTGIPQTRLSHIEHGKQQPQMNEIIAIAGALGSSLAELTGDSPVRQRLLCAARASQGSGMSLARRELTFYLELDAYLDQQPPPRRAERPRAATAVSIETEAEQHAARFRAEHGLGQAPIGDLVEVVESNLHVDVAVLDLGDDEHGMTMHDPERDASMIAVARTAHPMRQRSTVAHELAHVLFGDHQLPRDHGWDARSRQEKRADTFARHLLVPLPALTGLLDARRNPTLSDLSTLCQRFGASPAIVAIQAERAGYIDAQRKEDWKGHSTPSLAARFGWNDHYESLASASNARRAPQRLLARANAGYISGDVSVETIARLRGTSADHAQAYLDEHQIVREPAQIAWASLDDLPIGEDDFADLDADET